MTRPRHWYLLTWAWVILGIIGVFTGARYEWIATAIICVTLCNGIGVILEVVTGESIVRSPKRKT